VYIPAASTHHILVRASTVKKSGVVRPARVPLFNIDQQATNPSYFSNPISLLLAQAMNIGTSS
jgi:hypothetical protein